LQAITQVGEVSIAAQIITDMPLVHSGESKVETAVIRMEDKRLELNIILINCQNETQAIRNDIIRVEACLDVLRDKERFVIKQYYVDRVTGWVQVAEEYQCHYREWRSIKQLQSYRDSALDKIDNLLKLA